MLNGVTGTPFELIPVQTDLNSALEDCHVWILAHELAKLTTSTFIKYGVRLTHARTVDESLLKFVHAFHPNPGDTLVYHSITIPKILPISIGTSVIMEGSRQTCLHTCLN